LLKSFYKDNFKSELKIGGFHQFKTRTFNTRVFTVVENSGSSSDSLKKLQPNEIFRAANMNVNGFRYDEIPDPSYSYTGKQNLNAGYIMTDNIIDRFFRFTGGVRIEHFYQQLVTKNKQDSTIKPTINTLSILPSIAFTIIASNKTNIRFSYSKTVSRPDFREISPFSYFDFVNFVSIQGNDKLVSGQIHNYDARFETYPGEGQSFSIGGFYKKFINPIEQIVSPVVADGNRSIRFANAKSATVYGAEMEFRLKLRKLLRALKNWEFSGNLAYIQSQVEIGTDSANQRKRPLQGQSPYIANFGLFYNGRSSGWTIALNYNLVGPRIYSVGTKNYPDFYDKQRHVIDIQIAKSLSNRSELKLNIGDMLAQDYILYQNTDANTAFGSSDHIINKMKTAPLIILNYVLRLK
jgi:outer membrane receptor protein involved in Fe transport